ncbi:MAG TPA: hypothetical protein VGL09_17300 [Methylomirabilota bacterium]|jgi:hypothetical protein
MTARLRVLILLVAIVTLTDVATPPVIEDHLERGFCSADCPVQHAVSGAAIAAPAPPRAAHRLTVIVGAVARATEAKTRTTDAPDAPRAPPAA